MENREQNEPQNTEIQAALARYLSLRSSKGNNGAGRSHLDDDTLSAFIESSMSAREAEPVVAHLVDCSFCLHVTAELIRLDAAFADSPPAPRAAAASEPASVSAVLNGLLSRIFGTRDGAVFAHHETDEPAAEEDNEADKPEAAEDKDRN